MYLLIWSLDHRRFRIDHMVHCLDSFRLATLLLQSRVLNGFIHAYIDNEEDQILGLLLVSAAVFGFASRYYFTYKAKRGFVVTLCALAIKVLINIILNIEARMDFREGIPSAEEESLSSITTLSLYTLAILLVLQYIVTTCVAGCLDISNKLRGILKGKCLKNENHNRAVEGLRI